MIHVYPIKGVHTRKQALNELKMGRLMTESGQLCPADASQLCIHGKGFRLHITREVMDMIPCEGNIASFGWEKKILRVQFRDGGLYDFFAVPQKIYNRMKKAPVDTFRAEVRDHFKMKRVAYEGSVRDGTTERSKSV